MAAFAATQAWWRPANPTRAAEALPGSPLAFGALVSFTVILLLSPQTWIPVLQSFRIALVAAGVALGVHLLERLSLARRGFHDQHEIRIAFALVVWAVATVPLSYWPGGSLAVLTDHYLKAVAFFWLIAVLVTTERRARVLSWTLVLCAMPLAATAIANYLTGQFIPNAIGGMQRVYGYEGGSGLVTNPNDLALMLNLILPIAGAMAISRGSALLRVFATGVVLLSIGAVIVTFSRAGFLTLAAIFIVSIGMLIKRRAPAAATAALALALAVPLFLPDGYADRLSTITNIEADTTGSAQGRWEDWGAAAEVVADHPITGVGVGQDILALNERRGPTWRSVHNAYLQYAVDLGLPGLVLFVWLHLRCLKGARRAEEDARATPAIRNLAPLAAGVQVSLIAFGVAALFHPIAYQFFFFCFAGLAVALRSLCRHAAVLSVCEEDAVA